MQLRADSLPAQLERGLKPLYTIHGDEPLLAQEAADAVRAAARAAGYTERTVFTVAGAHFDWSGVLGAAQAQSLFGDKQLIEIRIPSGKPGKEGSAALQRYCELIRSAASDGVLSLVQLPRLDGQQSKSAWFMALCAAGDTLRVETLDRKQLPQWLAQRLSRQGQRVLEGEEGQRSLSFFADRIEGNLLAAHQEIQKLGLLYPPGELSYAQIEAAVLNVARFDVNKLCEAVWTVQVPRALRVLDGLRDEGESAVMVHWTLANDIRSLARGRAALDLGKPLPLALKEAQAWGLKEKLFERALPALADHSMAHLLDAASICDGLCKGLRHPQWPAEPWEALRHLVLMCMQAQRPLAPSRQAALQGRSRLVLQA